MPAYDVICELCGHEDEVFRAIARRDEPVTCPCGGTMVRCIGQMALVGAQPSKPIDLSKQLGRKFETNKEYRDYLASSGGREVDKSSFKPTIDAIHDSKDRKAKAGGYRDWRHRTQEIRKKASTG